MVTQEQLKQWQALADAATQGPWKADIGHVAEVWTADNTHTIAYEITEDADAAFIAAARAAVPALLAEVERLTAEVRRYEEAEHQREMEHEAANDY